METLRRRREEKTRYSATANSPIASNKTDKLLDLPDLPDQPAPFGSAIVGRKTSTDL